MLFRIDSIFEDTNRQYGVSSEYPVVLAQQDVESFIAEEIAKEINGNNERRLVSYSKSLGVCILKYNNYLDNNLHIAIASPQTHAGLVEVCYRVGNYYDFLMYYLQGGINWPEQYQSKIELIDFIADVSDNEMINRYFMKHLNRGKKVFASPEKDKEVVCMRAQQEKVITSDNIAAVYALYGLQMRYNFLSFSNIYNGLINDIHNFAYERRFDITQNQEIETFSCLIQYLACYGNYERNLSEAIRAGNNSGERLNFCYDALNEYYDIMNRPFYEVCYDSEYYNLDFMSRAVWNWCEKFLQMGS